jgi:hypothetical protein
VAVLVGQCNYQLCVPEDLNRALELANQLLTLGEARNHKAIQRAGLSMRGNVHVWLGNFLDARDDFERCLKLHASANRFTSVNSVMDPRASVLTNLSSALSYLGYSDQARARDLEALVEAQNFGHAFQRASALVLFFCNYTLQPIQDTLTACRNRTSPSYRTRLSDVPSACVGGSRVVCRIAWEARRRNQAAARMRDAVAVIRSRGWHSTVFNFPSRRLRQSWTAGGRPEADRGGSALDRS